MSGQSARSALIIPTWSRSVRHQQRQSLSAAAPDFLTTTWMCAHSLLLFSAGDSVSFIVSQGHAQQYQLAEVCCKPTSASRCHLQIFSWSSWFFGRVRFKSRRIRVEKMHFQLRIRLNGSMWKGTKRFVFSDNMDSSARLPMDKNIARFYFYYVWFSRVLVALSGTTWKEYSSSCQCSGRPFYKISECKLFV